MTTAQALSMMLVWLIAATNKPIRRTWRFCVPQMPDTTKPITGEPVQEQTQTRAWASAPRP